MANNFTYKSKESTTCAQCGRVVNLSDLKEGKYPKEIFKYNQKRRYHSIPTSYSFVFSFFSITSLCNRTSSCTIYFSGI